MTRIAAVSYLNTKPLLDGLELSGLLREIDLRLAVPSRCGEMFRDGEADVALVPVGSLLDLDQANILDGCCIGANGKVDSVFLFANEPVESVRRVYLDSHSRTSNGLARILMRRLWKQAPEFVSEPDYIGKIGQGSAGVVIGDKAVPLRDRFLHAYDLAAEWMTLTGLPFAFAVWVYRADAVSDNWLIRLKEAFALGLSQIDDTAARWAGHFDLTPEKAAWYLNHCIDFRFDAAKREALRLYLGWLAEIEAERPPRLVFA